MMAANDSVPLPGGSETDARSQIGSAAKEGAPSVPQNGNAVLGAEERSDVPGPVPVFGEARLERYVPQSLADLKAATGAPGTGYGLSLIHI